MASNAEWQKVKKLTMSYCSPMHASSVNSTAGSTEESTLLQLHELRLTDKEDRKKVSSNVLWDNGSQLTLITNKLANSLGLKGKRMNLLMVTAGNNTSLIESYEYLVKVIDDSGEKIEIWAMGIEKITSAINPIDLHQVATIVGTKST